MKITTMNLEVDIMTLVLKLITMKTGQMSWGLRDKEKLYINQLKSDLKRHQKLLKEIENDPVGQELYDELIGEATTYAEIRAKWLSLDRSQKMEQDSFRTACHNSVITHFNMMARYLKTQGKNTEWRDALGYEEDDKYYRKTIGDFGCYIVFVNSLCAR